MSDQQVDDFIEHFGVKGMHWGIRNQQQLDRVSRVARGTAARKQHRKDVAKKVALVGGISVAAIGAAYAIGKMRTFGKAPVSTLPMPFKAAGKNWSIQARDGRVFDTAVKSFTEQQRKAHRHGILERNAIREALADPNHIWKL